jgi:acyl-CoA dehydrogenase
MPEIRLSHSEVEVRQEMRTFALNILRPAARLADETGEVPEEILVNEETLALMRAFVPRQMGGGWRSRSRPGVEYDIAGSAMLRTLCAEELGYGDAALAVALPGPGLAEPPLRSLGSTEQQARYFNGFLGRTPQWASFALSEPKVGSDAAAIMTTARKEQGHYILNGAKWFIGNAQRAEWAVVFATVNPNAGRFGIRAFLVDRGAPGFTVGRILPTIGMKAAQVSELLFDECRVPRENLLGTEKTGWRDRGFDAAIRTFNLVRPGVAAMAVGLGRAIIEVLRELANQNGAHFPLAHRWRDLTARIERMEVRLHAVRLLCWKAAWLYDQGIENAQESSMAKALGAKVVMEVCAEAMGMAGKAGLRDVPLLEKWFRDIKAFDFMEGTGEIQRLMIARAALHSGAVPAQ